MSKVLNGKEIALKIEKDLRDEINQLEKKYKKTPTLVTILVGNNPSSIKYVEMKKKTCIKIGMNNINEHLSENTTTSQLIQLISKYNLEESIDGILIQHPLPSQINHRKVFDAIDLKKDVDGLTSINFGKMSMEEKTFMSATALSVKKIIEHYKINVEGKEVLVIGKSDILGKPVAMMLLNEDATVTVAHIKTKNLPKVSKRADIIISCTGAAKLLKSNYLKKGSIVIDAGYNELGLGDLDLKSSKKKLFAYSPVPGGVGPLTIVSLLEQTLSSFKERMNKNE